MIPGNIGDGLRLEIGLSFGGIKDLSKEPILTSGEGEQIFEEVLKHFRGVTGFNILGLRLIDRLEERFLLFAVGDILKGDDGPFQFTLLILDGRAGILDRKT